MGPFRTRPLAARSAVPAPAEGPTEALDDEAFTVEELRALQSLRNPQQRGIDAVDVPVRKPSATSPPPPPKLESAPPKPAAEPVKQRLGPTVLQALPIPKEHSGQVWKPILEEVDLED